MNYLKTLGMALLLCATTSLFAKAKHDPYKDVTIKTTKIKNGIYMLQGQGGNIGLSVGDDGVFMIDDQFAPLTKKIKKAIKAISEKEIKFTINTHWHFDHTGGNENLGNDGVILVSHDNVRKRMSKDNFIKAFNKTVPASPKIALPTVTFSQNMTFHLNNEEIEIIYQANAHTDGDSVVFFKNSNIIHTGDIYFNGFYPFIDASSGGNIDGVIKSVNYILSRTNDATKIIPGHGKLSNKKELIKYRDTLIIFKNRMQKLIDEGKTIDEIVAINPFSDLEGTWGNGFLDTQSFIKILYSVMMK
jgi:glyoxylase-like metal-dependent hydrolase (beta-lactamase superfamily II)